MEIYENAVDKGLEGVVACSTAISSIVDATLCYRGYIIEDLAANATYEEVAYLLWNDCLPDKNELSQFCEELGREMKLDANILKVLSELPTSNVHPMAWLRSAVSVLALYDQEAQDDSSEANRRKAIRMTVKIPLLVAAFQRFRQGLPVVQPEADKGIAWNFLYTLEGKEPSDQLARDFDVCMILHADHELNCSAFAARVTASSLSDIYSAVVSAISALKGPLHGGANEQVMKMLKEIGSLEDVEPWLEKALSEKRKIMGFGHRVYKNGDPRAKVLCEMSERLTAWSGQPHLYQMSARLDQIMQDSKGLLPNVDFYSATVYDSMKIPTDLFTPVFASARISGWLGHIFEQWNNNRIYRPRGRWIGKERLEYKLLEER